MILRIHALANWLWRHRVPLLPRLLKVLHRPHQVPDYRTFD